MLLQCVKVLLLVCLFHLSLSVSFDLLSVSAQGGGLTVYPDCVNGPLSSYAICNASLPALTRAESLISLLNVTEKVIRLGEAYGNNSIDRIGLPNYHWRQNAEHGMCGGPLYTNAGQPYSNNTMFPHVAGMTVSFDRSLWRAVGSAIADESRAFSNVGRTGLDWFTPNINIARDPRWGRTIEVPGEDPYLSAEYAANFIEGMQVGDGSDTKYFKTIATAKHFVAYDLDHIGTIDRSNYNAIVSPQDMAETYLPSWVAAIQRGKAGGVMCSYNAVNGVPVCASNFLLQTVLRDHLEFDPYAFVVSDCGAISNIYGTHHYAKTPEEAVAYGIKAGTDINCGSFYAQYGVSAFQKGLFTEEDMNVLLRRHFVTLIRLGYFDSDENQPYRHYGLEKINSPSTQQLAFALAQQSFTLLKNENSTLPLSRDTVKVLALIGPNANVSLIGSNGSPSPYAITIWDGFVTLTNWKIIYVKGCDINSNNTSGFDAAVSAAKSADAVVYVGGVNTSVEDEEKDRLSLLLPGVQSQLIEAISQAAPSPITVLLDNGGGLDVSDLKINPKIGAIAWIGWPGQSGGTAIVSVLIGDHSPSGRLIVTWYPAQYLQQVQYTDQSMRPSVNSTGRTYKFYQGTPVYPFGHGLSYSKFNYSYSNSSAINDLEYNIQAFAATDPSPISYSVNVTNLGPMRSDVTLLAFVSANVSYFDIMPPIKQLFDFTHVYRLGLGETAQVWFTMTLSSLYQTDPHGHQWLLPGEYTVTLNNEAPIQHKFRLIGEARLMNKFPGSSEIITPLPSSSSGVIKEL